MFLNVFKTLSYCTQTCTQACIFPAGVLSLPKLITVVETPGPWGFTANASKGVLGSEKI